MGGACSSNNSSFVTSVDDNECSTSSVDNNNNNDVVAQRQPVSNAVPPDGEKSKKDDDDGNTQPQPQQTRNVDDGVKSKNDTQPQQTNNIVVDMEKKDINAAPNENNTVKNDEKDRKKLANTYNAYIGMYGYEDHDMELDDDNGEAVLPMPRMLLELVHPQWQLKQHEKLGGGAFGEVFRGELRLTFSRRKDVAIKRFNLSYVQATFATMSVADVVSNMYWEALGVVGLNHPCVVQLLAVEANTRDDYALVYELCSGGTLQSRLQTEMSEGEKIRVALELASGLAYLHGQGRVHRDVKPENVLMDNKYHAKWSDLGVAQVDFTVAVDQKETRAVKAGIQDRLYSSPEAARGDSLPTKASDVYSFGLMLLHMCRGTRYLWADLKEALRCIASNDVESAVPILDDEWQLAPIIRSCLQLNPDDRPSSEALCEQIQSLPGADPLMVMRHIARLQVHEDPHYVPNFVTPKRQLQRVPAKSTQVYDEVTTVLNRFVESDSSERVLVLFGDGGTGKSEAVHYLADACKHIDVVPVFIRYGLSEWSFSSLKDSIKKCFQTHGCDDECVARDKPMVFIVDGYDELTRDMDPSPIEHLVGMDEWVNAKLIVTCRRTTVPEHRESAHFGEACQKMYLLPFTDDQTRSYLRSRDVNTKLVTASAMRLVENPLLLSLYSSCASYVRAESVGVEVQRRHIYDAYVRWWHEKFVASLPSADLRDEFDLNSFVKYAAAVSLQMFQDSVLTFNSATASGELSASSWHSVRQVVKMRAIEIRRELLAAQSNASRVVLSEEEFASMKMREVELMLNVCPIRSSEGGISFRHKTFWEYFCCVGFMSELRQRDDVERLSFGRRVLTHDAGLLQLLSEFVDVYEGQHYRLADDDTVDVEADADVVNFTRDLWDTVYGTRSSGTDDRSACVRGSNAVSILNRAGVPLSGRTLSGCQLGYDDEYVFDHTSSTFAVLDLAMLNGCELRGTNLRGASLQQACLDGSDFSGALVDNVSWGERASLLGHENNVLCVATCVLKPDVCVSGSTDGTVRVWDLTRAVCMCVLNEHETEVHSVTLSHDGRLIASGDKRGCIRVWSLDADNSVTCLYTISDGHNAHVTGVVFSKNAQHLYSVGVDGDVKGWACTNDKWESCMMTSMTAAGYDTFELTGIALSHDEQYVFACGWDDNITQYSTSDGALIHTFSGHEYCVFSIAVSPDDRWLYSGCLDGTIHEWNVTSGEVRRKFVSHTSWVTALTLSTDGQWLYSGSRDKSICRWSMTTGELDHTRTGHCATVTSLAISPSGSHLLSASRDQSIRHWVVDTTAASRTGMDDYKRCGGRVHCLAVSPNESFIYTATADQSFTSWTMCKWSSVTGRLVWMGKPDRKVGPPWCMCATTSVLCEGGYAGSMNAWDETTGRKLHGWMTRRHRVEQMMAYENIVYCLLNGTSMIESWKVTETEATRLKTFNLFVMSRFVLSHDGSMMVCVAKHGAVGLCATKSDRFTDTFDNVKADHVAVSNDSKTAYACGNRKLHCFDIKKAKKTNTINLQQNARALVGGSDPSSVFAFCEDGLIREYNGESDECVSVMKYGDDISGVTLSLREAKMFAFSESYNTLRCFALSHCRQGHHVCLWVVGPRALSSYGVVYDTSDDDIAAVAADDEHTKQLLLHSSSTVNPDIDTPKEASNGDTTSKRRELIGAHVSIDWGNNEWYVGVITHYKHGKHHVYYEVDGDKKWHNLSWQRFAVVQQPLYHTSE